MYSAILSLAAAGGVWCGLFFGGICEWPGATGWAVPSWLVFFIATQRFAKKGVDKVQAALQTCMAEGQARMQAKVQRLQMRINSISAMKQALQGLDSPDGAADSVDAHAVPLGAEGLRQGGRADA